MNAEQRQALHGIATQFGATRTDLERIASTLDQPLTPTVAEFADVVAEHLHGRTADTYQRHINRLVLQLGARRLDDISLLDLEAIAVAVRHEALGRASARHGYGAQESFVNATRFFFTAAVKAGVIRENPSLGLARPRRRRSARRALSADELAQVFSVAVATSRDPELDLLILAFARETACRREGILNLRTVDVHSTPSVLLYEKFDEHREIPVTSALASALNAHADDRSDGCGRVFHYADGTCLTERRFDTLFARIGRRLPWVKGLGVSLHWLRYSTLTDVRLVAGERVAAAYAGHGDHGGGITAAYTRATFSELQHVHALLFAPQRHSCPEWENSEGNGSTYT